MYCMTCGQQLPDDAAFCFKCGAATHAAPGQPLVESKDELCRVREKSSFMGRIDYYAEVSGPDGLKLIQTTDMIRSGKTTEARLDVLVDQLLRDGWERIPTTVGNPQFRRRVLVPQKPTVWETCEVRCGPIKRNFFSSAEVHFVAVRGDQDADQVVLESPAFKLYEPAKSGGPIVPRQDRDSLFALKALVRDLVKTGWEQTSTGSEWFNHRFRRPAR